ncbi:MAG: S8 family serine peptidase [Candidatus Thermoplasmatota archaeon]
MEIKPRILAVLLGLVLVIASFSTITTSFDDRGETDIVLISLEGENDLSSMKSAGGEILEKYPDRALVELPGRAEEELRSKGIDINTLPARTELSVKGHSFDFEKENPPLSEDMMIDGYREGTEGRYIVHMLGPVNPEWRDTLEGKGVEIVNYIPNYAYHVRMTPDMKKEISELEFVDWVGYFHPGYKIDAEIEPGEVEVYVGKAATRSSLKSVSELFDGTPLLTKKTTGDFKLRGSVSTMVAVENIAQNIDVYWINNYEPPTLNDEIGTQINGGYFYRDNTSASPYRGPGDHGSHANQLGYTGSGITIQVADTGLGDGSTPDAGHNDYTGRVAGGSDLGSTVDGWDDQYGHGTHCAGLAAGDTYNGNGITYAGWADFYVSQGSAPDSELWATQVFEGTSGDFPSTYYAITEDGKQNGAYISSNSWGEGTGDSSYDASDEEYDRAVRDADNNTSGDQPLSIFVSAGNNDGYNSITSPGSGKNVVTVASHNNYMPDSDTYGHDYGPVTGVNTISDFSNGGLENDGRIKPDVAATGSGDLSTSTPTLSSSNLEGFYSEDDRYEWCSGTSMACPTAAGAGAVIADYYQSTYGSLPSPAMIKALMINAAQDMDDSVNTGPIPNRDEGWGRVFLPPIVDQSTYPNWVLKDRPTQMQTGDIDSYNIQVDNTDKPLNISMVYTDKEAASGDSPTLKNDLQLRVTDPSGTVWYGNAFSGGMSVSGSGNIDSNWDTDGDDNDDRNNLENVFIPSSSLESGGYTVEVEAFDVPEDGIPETAATDQDYALAMYNAATVTSDGTIFIENDEYSVEDTVNITVNDADLAGAGTLDVNIHSDTEPTNETVTLTETSVNGSFEGSIDISSTDSAGVLQVSDGDTITAYYDDADTGDGTSATKTDTAAVDGSVVGPSGLTVEWWGEYNKTELYDDAEGGDLGYSTGGTENWVIRTHGANSGTHSWDFGDGDYQDPSNGGMSYLTSPTVDLSDAKSATLKFYHWRDFESDNNLWDGGNVKISTDGGNSWSIITPEGGYDGTAESGYDNPLAGEPVWGYSSGWVQAEFDLSAYSGNSTVNIRWEAGVDNYGTSDAGWRVDDINITKVVRGGTEDNILNWTLSGDDGSGEDDVERYNIYRSDSQSGPWDSSAYLTSVPAGTDSYMDKGKGEADNTRWWYVVRAVDNVGNEDSNTNAEPEPGAGNTAPASPMNPSPIDGATGVSTSPTLSANVSDPDGDTMDVTFYDASDDSQIGQNTGVTNGTTSVTWSGLATNTAYSWYVVADDGSLTNTSATWSFTTGNTEPDAPYNPSPANGATGVSTTTSLSVDVSDPDGETMDVSFYWDDGTLIETVTGVSSGTTASTSSLNLNPGTTYSWYAEATDGSLTNTSSTWSFTTTTTNQEPDAPVNPSPANGATDVSLDPSLSVDVSDPDGDSMDVSFYNASDDSLIGTDLGVASGSTASVTWSGLATNTAYSWYAEATDGSLTNTSSTWSFTTGNYTVEITSPGDQTRTAGNDTIIDSAAYDSGGNLVTDNRTDFEWENATRGVFNRRRVGDYTVTATYEGVSNSTTITVVPAEADRIEISPEEETATAGGVVSYTAVAYDAYENEIGDVSVNTTWSVEAGANGSWIGSDYTTEIAGDWTVTGDYNGLTDTALLKVEPGAVDIVELTPSADQTITSGETIEFSASAYDAYGNIIADNVEAFNWENATRGIFYYETTGQYNVTATYNGVNSSPTTVTVQEGTGNTISTEIATQVSLTFEDEVEVTENVGVKYVAHKNCSYNQTLFFILIFN